MENLLDNLQRLHELDQGNMLEALYKFPEYCKSAIERAMKIDLHNLVNMEFSSVIFAGIGGSSIGGTLIADWLRDESNLPITISRSFKLPAFVDKKSLVIVVSYSGNTEETLSMLRDGLSAKSSIIIVTSGGEMEKISKMKDLTSIPIPKGLKPRAALPFQFFSIATALHNIGFYEKSWNEIGEALFNLKNIRDQNNENVSSNSNTAKKVAIQLYNKIPFVYGSQLLEGVAYRFRTQLNENSKVPAGSGNFPEAFHNMVLGSEADKKLINHLSLVLLQDQHDNIRMKEKIDRLKELYKKKTGDIIELKTTGEGRLSRMFSLIFTGDYVSTYLGFLNNTDPSSNWAIDQIKKI